MSCPLKNVDSSSPEKEEEEEGVQQMQQQQQQQQFSEEQKARASLNYRAAKALLARKRPHRHSYHFPSSSNNNSRAKEEEEEESIIKRVPLSELSANTPIRAFPDKRFRSGYSQATLLTPCSGLSPTINPNVLVATTLTDTNVDDLDSFTTPAAKQSQFKLGHNIPPHILDDDDDDYFDDSILGEIDVLCRQQRQQLSPPPSHVNNLEESAHHLSATSPQSNANQNNSVRDSSLVASSKLMCNISSNMPTHARYLDSLSERQQEAACCDISIPLMIVAGPGSGKTSTMVGRILVMLSEGLHPSNILAMTFTTAAASEMRDRIGAIAGKEAAKELTISTFHSFSLQLCRLHAEKLGRTPEFSVFGQGQQRRVVIEAMRLLEKENSNYNAANNSQSSVTSANHIKDKSKKWQKFITQAKASGKSPRDYIQLGNETGAAILEHYNYVMTTCNALDYHDLISCSVKLLKDYPEVLKECQDTWKALIIDEFQDTSAMQYSLLQILASHDHITIVGDDDQSIFSFNGADISGFDSFRKDFPNHKEIRLNKNYRSTRCIVEAASSLIRNNVNRCQFKNVHTDNSSGSKVTIKECHNEEAQCSFVIDKILETISNGSAINCTYGDFAILYRRQVSGKVFQAAFRARKIPFNIHGVAFYRKKVVRAIFSMLKTTLPGCDDGPYRQVFKALLPFEKEEKKKVIDHIEKVSAVRKSSFISGASDIFNAKISGTFKRSQLTQGRKVLSTLEMISKLVHREQSISTVITLVANMIPQKYLLEQRAAISNDGGKLLNEDDDLRSVLQYLLDDVSKFLMTPSNPERDEHNKAEGKGCLHVLKTFVDFVSDRERENFRSRRHDNGNSVTLTTMHQSKGLEWDTVFIVKTNDSEIPLLNEFNGAAKENGSSMEEERRLLYVAMTRARKQLFILYILMDSSWQMLQPSRFLKEIPGHLLDIQGESSRRVMQPQKKSNEVADMMQSEKQCLLQVERMLPEELQGVPNGITAKEDLTAAMMESCSGSSFLKRFSVDERSVVSHLFGRFSVDERSVVSHLFHQWAKRPAFKDPKRLIDKVGFVIDERLRMKKNKHKDVLGALKSSLKSDEAFQYAEYVLRWEQLPADQRAHLMREKQEHFQRLKIEKSMGSSAATSKQISYLHSLGCTVTPASRLHASRLIEQYKSL